jgi:hypothetical protein
VLRVLYALRETQNIFAVDREEARGKSHVVFVCCEGSIELAVHESNHNVAVWWRKKSNLTQKEPGARYRFRLLHPYDPARSKKLVFDASDLDDLHTNQKLGWPNFMTSKELDEYTVNGKYYVD